jgi:hypothetical protein
MAECIPFAIHASDDAGVSDAIPSWAISWAILADDSSNSESEFTETAGIAGLKQPREGEWVQ